MKMFTDSENSLPINFDVISTDDEDPELARLAREFDLECDGDFNTVAEYDRDLTEDLLRRAREEIL